MATITGALYSGVSGLDADSTAMSVIGNNLSNTGTTGFKGSSTLFSDMLSSTIYGSGGSSQVGRGVQIAKVNADFSQGTFQSTNSGTDCAIEGTGFFILRQPGDLTDYYSRDGSFHFDANGYLVNSEGYRVQGQLYDTSGNLIPGNPTDIQVNSTSLVAGTTTTAVTLNTNLDSSSTVPTGAFNYLDPTTYNYSSSVQVYDSLGNSHMISLYFAKTANNTWDWYWTAQDSTGALLGNVQGGTLTFNTDGTIASGGTGSTITAASLPWNNGSTSSTINMTFNTTQYNSNSEVISQSQDGYGAGNLTGIDIDTTGVVTASYSNGVQQKVANLSLANITNPLGLEAVGNNMFLATTTSGTPIVGLPGAQLGKIFTNSLEQSNVDMGSQFVNMIEVQRDFQANSKIVTTIDGMLNDVINMVQG